MTTLIALSAILSAAPISSTDKKFIEQTAEGGMTEVRLAELALKNAASADVKEFAQHMVDDHSKANAELKELAERKQVAISDDINAEHKRLEEKLTGMSGETFDREFMKIMVADHKKTVSAFEKTASAKSSDPDLKAWANTTLPTLRHHLGMAESTNKALKPIKS